VEVARFAVGCVTVRFGPLLTTFARFDFDLAAIGFEDAMGDCFFEAGAAAGFFARFVTVFPFLEGPRCLAIRNLLRLVDSLSENKGSAQRRHSKQGLADDRTQSLTDYGFITTYPP
jgi:hypothetical protein